MANIGLAAQLAKQAAQAARDEVAAASGSSTPQAPAKPVWTVPVLAHNFALDAAVQRAARQVTGHYQHVLAPQGLEVSLERGEAPAEATGNVAETRQDVPQIQASLREQGTGRLVKAYTTPAFLTMFATQQQATGVVVDGQV